MKTLQELYKEITASDELKAAFAEAAKGGKTLEFLKEKGCEATAEELKGFLTSRTEELSDEELDNASGGGCNENTSDEAGISLASFGFGCAIYAAVSAATGHVGQQTDTEGRLCH